MEGHADLLKELRLAGAAASAAGLKDLTLLLKRAHDAVTGEDAMWEPVMAKITELGGLVTQLQDLTDKQNGKLYALMQAMATRDPSVRPECQWLSHGNDIWSAGCGAKFKFSDIAMMRFCLCCGYKVVSK